MTKESRQMLAKLEQLDWFCNAGKPVSSDEVKQVGSWKEALRFCQTRESDNVQLESRNILTEKLWAKFTDRYRKWNELVAEIKKQTDELLRKRVLKSPHCPKLPEQVVVLIRSDLRMILMELEYADLIPPRFFAERAKWYLAGHFPCGWDGDFPQGRLIVY